jgi:hypothetical protein
MVGWVGGLKGAQRLSQNATLIKALREQGDSRVTPLVLSSIDNDDIIHECV